MTAASASLSNESPGCNPGLLSNRNETPFPGGLFLRQEHIQMRINQNRDRNNPAQLTHEEMRRRCKFWLKRMAKPMDADDINRKRQFDRLNELTKLGVRRVEKLFRGNIPKPNALDYETIKLRYGEWLKARKAYALSEADQLEDEYEEFQNAVADYGSARWQGACSNGHGARPVGESGTG